MDITDLYQITKRIDKAQPDVLLNLSAYTNVEDAQDIGNKNNYEVNTI
jgi:dTDP-4-dehydrorhamnose reductase